MDLESKIRINLDIIKGTKIFFTLEKCISKLNQIPELKDKEIVLKMSKMFIEE